MRPPGTSWVTGTGPAGSLDASHVYAVVLYAFCESLTLITTPEASLAYPYLDGTGLVRMQVPPGSINAGGEWSGTLPATISLPDESKPASGTAQVDYANPTKLRATARFDEGAWHFTATIDAPYWQTVNCF